MLKRSNLPLNNEHGFSAVEVIPVIVVIVLLVNFTVGFFGVIHSGILNSIAARNYAFETFRHRSDLTYFRNIQQPGTPDEKLEFRKLGMRIHSTLGENAKSDNTFVATLRTIDLRGVSGNGAEAEEGNDTNTHSRSIASLNEAERNTGVSVNPVWIKISYGICLNTTCESTP